MRGVALPTQRLPTRQAVATTGSSHHYGNCWRLPRHEPCHRRHHNVGDVQGNGVFRRSSEVGADKTWFSEAVNSHMLELLRLLPRRPLAISLAAWTLFFVLQIVFLTVAVYRRYVSPPEPPPLDHLWFLYTELPRALPMAAVYAVCMVFVAQVMGRFIAKDNPDNLTVANWYELLKKNPAKAILWMGLRVILLLGLVGLFINLFVPLSSWITALSVIFVGIVVGHLMFASWSNWVVEQISSRDGDNAH